MKGLQEDYFSYINLTTNDICKINRNYTQYKKQKKS